jgi:tetratricopeptide (TPR) repeat protein
VLGSFALAVLSLMGGWWLGQRQLERAGPDRSRLELEKQADRLRVDVARGAATESQQQRLLQLLLALEKKDEATQLLERMADQQPDRWPLRLMLAELRRDQNDRSGAEREVRQILNLRPDRIEALQLMTLLQLEQGRGEEAEAQLAKALQSANQPRPTPKGMGIGLVLADLLQRRGRIAQADELYHKLSVDYPTDVRPVLGRALLKEQQGQNEAALDLLAQARQRNPELKDPRLDQVAAAWGLAPLRRAVGVGGSGAKAPSSARTPEKPSPQAPPPEPTSAPGP